MMKKTITAALAGLAVLAVPSAAFATVDSTGGTKKLHVRKGLTLTIPKSWKVYHVEKDWLRVVTGRCASLGSTMFGFRDSGCRSFWVLGPRAIKVGHELFRAYTPDRPFYPATDVGPCPYDKNLWLGRMDLSAGGLRQVGRGHKAYYRKWRAQCLSPSRNKVKGHFNQREWYLPTSQILIIDQWDNPKLSGILRHATWR